MGVPKFYRWISERYPCLSSLVKEDGIPEFDNFYLDMNGIIHHCSHPNDADVNFRISEEEIFKSVFSYINVLFSFIRPKKVLFLAIDGCAPRAKMNQQRGRRFRTAKDAKEQELQARREGKKLAEEARFDSNVITPGTDFMERLDNFLQYSIAKKISTDPSWQKVEVHYSSHLVPGEGEHKILDYIRFIRSQPNYDPYTRHCLYGLDADLIMLGLSVHEPFISLLREEVKFGKSSEAAETNPEKITFHLLHLSLMRGYLDHEFESLRDTLPFQYDFEKIIDDWILMGFLVGNDFIPHLPGLHINKSAFEDIYDAYKRVLPTLKGYLNEGGYLQLDRFQAFLSELERNDLDKVEDEMDDLSWMEKKGGAELGAALMCDPDLWDAAGKDDFKFEKMPEDGDSDEEDTNAILQQKLFAHKEKYYKEKLRLVEVNDETLADLACEYVRAIQWNLHYYYHGVPSWSWYYPYHYAPYISDLKNFGTLDGTFEMAVPFKPFEQLLAVLPARSKSCLPTSFHSLFNSSSPIYDFYPEDFATDMNGKANDWEAVVLIPFIEENRLLVCVKERSTHLTPAELNRNRVGPGLVFRFSQQPSPHPYAPPSRSLPPIHPCRATIMHYDYKFHCLKRESIKKGPFLTGEMYSPGFPTLGFVEHTGELKRGGVQIFTRRSEGKSMVLKIATDPEANYLREAEDMLGGDVYVNWPNHTKARAEWATDGLMKSSIANKDFHRLNQTPEIVTTAMSAAEISIHEQLVKDIESRLKTRKGIEPGKIEVLLYVSLRVGDHYNIKKDGRAFLEPIFSDEVVPFPMQLVTRDSEHEAAKPPKRIFVDALFPVGSQVFLMAHPFYGHQGRVELHNHRQGVVQLVINYPTEPNLETVMRQERGISAQYEPAFKAAKVLNMSPPIVSRLTGTVFARINGDSEDKVNIGLSLKATKANTEMRGYTKRVEQDNNPGEFTWLYSNRVLDILYDYRKRFPELFEFLLDSGCQDPFMENIYPRRGAAKLQEIKAFLATLPTAKQNQQTCGAEFLDDYILEAIQTGVHAASQRRPGTLRTVVIPRLLYKWTEETDKVAPDPTVTWEVYDRVVNVREGSVIPVGLRGTVIGIAKAELLSSRDSLTVLYDKAFSVGDHMTKSFETPAYALLNLSHGQRKQWEMQQKHGQKFFLHAEPVRTG
ncbi:5'-3' exoribonuclease 1 [Hypsibius exemplaris]|uniref:5'-3' exoribonuclease 1 n=1 Tax=Hypsibius exemplaris TaxID=2072580 RepID=A0A1W0WN69_HYPEX|nr:5'-3' exoribonuclease 1 [Hypsibius exemplaris]